MYITMYEYNWHNERLCFSLQKYGTNPTNILPVVVWPDMSSPAQSLASVTHPISVSGPLAAAAAAPTPPACFSSWTLPGLAADLFWQHNHANILHVNTSRRPTKKVMRLEHRKAYQCLSRRHSSARLRVVVETVVLFDIFRPTHDHSYSIVDIATARTQNICTAFSIYIYLYLDHTKCNK